MANLMNADFMEYNEELGNPMAKLRGRWCLFGGGGHSSPPPVPQLAQQPITPPPSNAPVRDQSAAGRFGAAGMLSPALSGAAASALAGGLKQNGPLTRLRKGFSTTPTQQSLG